MNKKTGPNHKVILVVTLVALVLIVAYALFVERRVKVNPRTTPSDCVKLCNTYKELERVRSQNIDLRAKLAKMEEDYIKNPPNSRHFYNCRESKEDGGWNLAIYSVTTGKIFVYECDAWRGHTGYQNSVPEEKQKKLTCTDQKGVSYPQ